MSLAEVVANKKILFICPVFHHYHLSIQQCLRQNGAVVYFIPAFRESWLSRVSGRDKKKQASEYYADRFSKIKHVTLDLLFQIKGEDIEYDILQDQMSRCRASVMYQWDSLNNCKYLHLTSLFDKVYTFDRTDASVYPGLKYLQLFYEENNIAAKQKQYDLLSVAGYSHWRHDLTNRIFQLAKKNNLSVYVHLYTPFKTLVRLWFSRRRVNFKLIYTRRVGPKKYAQLLAASSTVLDIPISNQAGISIRTIETIGAKKKLITTNKNVHFEQFFSPESILIIDENIDEQDLVGFIKKEIHIATNIEALKLDNWLKQIILST
jgi:hypothetical protein